MKAVVFQGPSVSEICSPKEPPFNVATVPFSIIG